TACRPPAPAAPAAHHIAKQIVKNIRHGSGESFGPRAKTSVLKSCMTVTVISGSLLRIRQGLIGLVQFLEANFGFRIAGIAIRMTLHGRFAKSGLKVAIRASLSNPKY